MSKIKPPSKIDNTDSLEQAAKDVKYLVETDCSLQTIEKRIKAYHEYFMGQKKIELQKKLLKSGDDRQEELIRNVIGILEK